MLQEGAAAGCPPGCDNGDENTVELAWTRKLDDGRIEVLEGPPECWEIAGYQMCTGSPGPEPVCDCACYLVAQ